jgi:hypothetical protein
VVEAFSIVAALATAVEAVALIVLHLVRLRATMDRNPSPL